MASPTHNNVKAGEGCRIAEDADLHNVICGNNVVIDSGVQLRNVIIGDNTKISRRVTLYTPDEANPITIGREVWLSQGVFGEATGGKISIGDFSVIAYYTTLLTSSGPGKKSVLLDELFPAECGDIVVNDHCWLGAHNLVLPHVYFAEGNVLASNSLARQQDYKPWSLYAGNPAVLKKSFDLEYIRSLKEKHKKVLEGL